jgi:hypothetical protein
MNNPARVYTFGYEGLDIATFIATLRANGVQTIVDVRELPLSRKKGFSKSAFSAALSEAGVAYLHMPRTGLPQSPSVIATARTRIGRRIHAISWPTLTPRTPPCAS